MDEERRKKLIREIVVLLAGSAVFLYFLYLGTDYLYIPLVIGVIGFEFVVTVQTYRISILLGRSFPGYLIQIVWTIAFLLIIWAEWWMYPPAASPIFRYYNSLYSLSSAAVPKDLFLGILTGLVAVNIILVMEIRSKTAPKNEGAG
jgi:hypothetical protein